ncbi:MAG: hypothetical protein RLZZ512_1903 [Bacteroidota bacterium]|jgi:hypothetical protein
MMKFTKTLLVILVAAVGSITTKPICAQSLEVDTVINLSAIVQKIEKQQTEIDQIKAANTLAGIKIQLAGQLQNKSFNTIVFGSALGGMVFLASGNVALWSAISGTSAIVATAQKLKSNRLLRQAGEQLQFTENKLVNDVSVVTPIDTTATIKPNAFMVEYASEFLYFDKKDKLYIHAHSAISGNNAKGINGPMSLNDVHLLMKKNADYIPTILPTITELKQIFQSDTKLRRRLYQKELIVWSSSIDAQGNSQCLNFRTGEITVSNATALNYFVPIVKLNQRYSNR